MIPNAFENWRRSIYIGMAFVGLERLAIAIISGGDGDRVVQYAPETVLLGAAFVAWMHHGFRFSIRWFRFRLRTLFAVVALLCVPLAWVTSRADQRRSECAAAHEIEKLGGHIWFQSMGCTCSSVVGYEHPGPRWLRRILGDSYFDSVRLVSFLRFRGQIRERPFRDDDIQHLKKLTRAEAIDVEWTEITDAGLAELQSSLPHCRISR
jgi:hypothetical protein